MGWLSTFPSYYAGSSLSPPSNLSSCCPLLVMCEMLLGLHEVFESIGQRYFQTIYIYLSLCISFLSKTEINDFTKIIKQTFAFYHPFLLHHIHNDFQIKIFQPRG